MTETGKAREDNLFEIDFGDLDFDLDDFDFEEHEPDTRTRILQPKIDTGILTQTVHFDHAIELAEKIDLSGNTRTYAWVSGSFIFGDILEALWRRRNIDIKELSMVSLSISEENIDSWAGLLAQGNIEKFNLVCSAYFYSHYKFDMVPYLYQQLANDPRVQIAFGAYHMKIITLETHHGNTLTIHGSANMRSSMNIEQMMFEPNNRELHEFNARMIGDICNKYGTINHNAEPMTRTETRQWFNQMKEGSGENGQTKSSAIRLREHKGKERRKAERRADVRK